MLREKGRILGANRSHRTARSESDSTAHPSFLQPAVRRLLGISVSETRRLLGGFSFLAREKVLEVAGALLPINIKSSTQQCFTNLRETTPLA